MANTAYFLMAALMGAIMAIYLPILSQSGKIIGSPILANVPFYALGLITSFFLALGMGNGMEDFGRLRDVPPWMFVAGVVSGIMILGSTFLIPKISPGPFFVLLVAGQILMGSALSHYGLLGSPIDVMSLRKLAGLILVMGGAYLVTIK